MLVFAYHLRLLPAVGRIDSDIQPPIYITGFYLLDSLLTANFSAFVSSFRHVIIPATTLSLSAIAQIMRYVRASLIDQTTKEYILVARANGLPINLITFKYMLKNAFSATLTSIGLLYGFLIGNAFVVETLFAWPGIASYGINALLYKDFNAITAVALVVGVVYISVNFIIDLLYVYIDPRITLVKG